MCFDADARPPDLPADLVRGMAGGAKAELLELSSADGTRFSAALAGAVGFYAGLNTERWGIKSPVERAAEMHGPLLGLFGGADQGIPVELVERFDGALADAGVEHEIKVYPGAPHSFFDRKYEE